MVDFVVVVVVVVSSSHEPNKNQVSCRYPHYSNGTISHCLVYVAVAHSQPETAALSGCPGRRLMGMVLYLPNQPGTWFIVGSRHQLATTTTKTTKSTVNTTINTTHGGVSKWLFSCCCCCGGGVGGGYTADFYPPGSHITPQQQQTQQGTPIYKFQKVPMLSTYIMIVLSTPKVKHVHDVRA